MALTTPAVPATTIPQVNNTGQWADVAVTGGTLTGILVTPPVLPPVTTPAVPATTVTATNTNAFPVAVTIAANGATITAITVNGVASGLTVGTVVVPAGGTVSVSYTVATPTWVWTALSGGFSGTSIPSPSSIAVPPSGAITLIYSAAPTWAWSDPIDVGYTPGYGQPNTGPTNQEGQLPWPQHTVGGEAGLGEAVSN